MNELMKALQEPLKIDQIDFRVQSINRGGYATILAYKDARADMQRLDEVCGPLNWQRRHCRENHNCVVSIYNAETGEWVSKEDTGTESNTEQQKGLASDSFKRACTNWGIGRELYDYPVIQVKLRGDGQKNDRGYPADKDGEWVAEGRTGKPQASFNLKLKDWLWYSEFTDGRLSFLAAKDSTGIRFKWGVKRQEQAA